MDTSGPFIRWRLYVHRGRHNGIQVIYRRVDSEPGSVRSSCLSAACGSLWLRNHCPYSRPANIPGASARRCTHHLLCKKYEILWFITAGTKLGQGNIFTDVCLSTGGVCLSTCWDKHPPRADTPPPRPDPFRAHTPDQTPPEQTPPNQNPPLPDTPRDQNPPPPDQTPLGADTPLDQTPPEQTHPPDQTPPGKQTPAYGQRAAGTHPTGMHSCSHLLFITRLRFFSIV